MHKESAVQIVGERYGAAIDRLLARNDTVDMVADYLDDASHFAAYSFDDVGLSPPDEITSDDVLAVSSTLRSEPRLSVGSLRPVKSSLDT